MQLSWKGKQYELKPYEVADVDENGHDITVLMTGVFDLRGRLKGVIYIQFGCITPEKILNAFEQM